MAEKQTSCKLPYGGVIHETKNPGGNYFIDKSFERLDLTPSGWVPDHLAKCNFRAGSCYPDPLGIYFPSVEEALLTYFSYAEGEDV